MTRFFKELEQRNRVLFYFGSIMFMAFFACFVASYFDHTHILGINAWIKPMKFYLSIGIMTWTLGWLTYYLSYKKQVKIFSLALVISMTIEMVIITYQAARGQKSHFNESSLFNGILFAIMGITITTFVVWTAYICILFFLQKEFSLSKVYVLSIRLGLIVFVLFSFEGWVIVGNNKHTVGAADGLPGLPFVNWSRQYGDLRVAHFFGMHALQIFPLVGYYITRKNVQIVLFAVSYVFMVTLLLLEAVKGVPLIR